MMVLLSYSLIVLLSYSPIEKDTLARYYLEVGEIKKAEEVCLRGSSESSNLPDTFLLGEIAYFNYKFEQALELYDKVSSDSKDGNDAIARMILIKANDEKELQNYVTAELSGRKKKFEEGIKILRKLSGGNKKDKPTPTDSLFLTKTKNLSSQNNSLSRAVANRNDTLTKVASAIAPWAEMLLIDFLRKMGKHEEALKECQNFIKRFPQDDKEPQVKLEMAKIYVGLGKRKEALETYKEILLKHPKSAVASIAREKLESL